MADPFDSLIELFNQVGGSPVQLLILGALHYEVRRLRQLVTDLEPRMMFLERAVLNGQPSPADPAYRPLPR